MRLLILTQAVDLDDPILGFFHRWIAEFAKNCEKVTVICLREGRHELPAHVSVHSLGKESGVSRIKYLLNFYKYIWSYRNEYDNVFIHMNPEYVVLGWKIWWILRKRIVLWYVHPKKSLLLRIAVFFSDAVCSVTASSVNVKSKKIHAVGHGIDVNDFNPNAQAPSRTVLWLGRLDPVKRTEIFIEALERLQKEGIIFSASIYGSPVAADEKYSHDLRNKMAPLTLSGALVLHDAISHAETPDVYSSHAVYVNLTPSGSFDKTILEAMAAGRAVVAANNALPAVLPAELHSDGSPEGTARAIRTALEMTPDRMREIGRSNREYVEKNHALPVLIGKLIRILK